MLLLLSNTCSAQVVYLDTQIDKGASPLDDSSLVSAILNIVSILEYFKKRAKLLRSQLDQPLS